MKRIREHKEGAAYRAFLYLISKDLDDARKKNDTAEGHQVYRNQGVSQYLNRLLKEMGFDPERGKPQVFDGAFD